MAKDTWIVDKQWIEKPSAARIYDYMLGGYHNFEMDRLAAEKALEIYPDARRAAHTLRAFLRRVVHFFAEQGIDQFLDIGSGLPTVGNVHEAAQKANPAARIVYVDIDPIVVAHARALLKDNPQATAIRGDVGQPETILNHEEVQGLLDFSRPVGLLLLGVLNFVTEDDRAYATVRTLRDALVPGSYVAIAHGTRDDLPPEVTERSEKLSRTTSTPNRYRSRAEIEPFFEGLELVEPGLVRSSLWRPEGPDDVFLDEPERARVWSGVGVKRKREA